MLSEIQFPCLEQVLYCDREPDSRNKTSEKLTGFGYSVLATGNLQIASAMAQEKPLAALVVSAPSFDLAMVSVIAEARRSKPSLPILVLLAERSGCGIPSGLADIVLISPSDRAVRESLQALTYSDQPTTKAS